MRYVCMNFKRTRLSAKKTPLKYDSQGNILCRWCEKCVHPPRKTFCSAECVHNWKLRSNLTYARRCVRQRDRGVCSKCGTDTYKISRGMRKPLRGETEAAWKKRVKAIRKKYKIGPRRVTLWDMDHIQEVAVGGGQCGLDNLITLCTVCHKQKTKKFVKKHRAKKKTASKRTKRAKKADI